MYINEREKKSSLAILNDLGWDIVFTAMSPLQI